MSDHPQQLVAVRSTGLVYQKSPEEVIEMRNSIDKSRITLSELVFLLIGLLLLLAFARLVNGQSEAPRAAGQKAHAQVQKPLYNEYRGVRLGMAASEVRAKLGEPAMKSDEQDFFVISPNETAQIVYNAAQKVTTISTDYTGGVGAPDYKSVVGEGLTTRPNGSLFKMAMYDSERFWVTYSKSATTVPIVTITIAAYK